MNFTLFHIKAHKSLWFKVIYLKVDPEQNYRCFSNVCSDITWRTKRVRQKNKLHRYNFSLTYKMCFICESFRKVFSFFCKHLFTSTPQPFSVSTSSLVSFPSKCIYPCPCFLCLTEEELTTLPNLLILISLVT